MEHSEICKHIGKVNVGSQCEEARIGTGLSNLKAENLRMASLH